MTLEVLYFKTDTRDISNLHKLIPESVIPQRDIRDMLIYNSKADIQSIPVISRLLGTNIRERELSGSPVISRCRAKAPTREFRITDPHSQAFTSLKQYVER